MPPSTHSKHLPLKDDAMNAPNYFKSSVDTLLESIHDTESDHVSLHDITEAYNTFSTRTIAHITVISQADYPLPALNLPKVHSSQIIQSLRRDVRRALLDPSIDFTHQYSPFDGSMRSESQELNEDEIKYARDLSSLCHQSLRFLSDILRFPALYSIFPSVSTTSPFLNLN